MKRAFTLIELLVVISILTILFGIGMNFGGNRIAELKAQTMKERFVDAYSSLVDQRLISSYQGNTRYRELTISFASGIVYAFDSGISNSLFPRSQHMWLSGLELNGKGIDSLDVVALPYQLPCAFSLSGDLLVFRLMTDGAQYCFSVDAPTCRLRESACLSK